MNILLAGYTSMPYTGGVAVYINTLSRELQRMGHHVDILVHKPGMNAYYMPNTSRELNKKRVALPIDACLSARYRKARRRVHPLVHKYERERYSFELAAACFGLEQYDVIHAQDLISGRALWRVKPPHVPLVLTLHSYWRNHPRYLSFFKSCGAVSSDATITPSQWLKDQLIRHHHVPADHITVIPNGVPSALFDTLPSPAKHPSDPTIFVCTARLSAEKGHRYLLQALSKVKRVRSDWKCWLVGTGPLHSRLRAQCRQLGLQNHVDFLGNRHDVPLLLQKADVFVLASLKDIFPFAVLEAQMAGKPVVVTNAGGIKEMVEHGVTGLISPAGDSEQMARHILALLEDHSLRSSLAANGRRQALAQWTAESMARRVLAVYEHVKRHLG